MTNERDKLLQYIDKHAPFHRIVVVIDKRDNDQGPYSFKHFTNMAEYSLYLGLVKSSPHFVMISDQDYNELKKRVINETIFN